jgi:Flp pilus assembly protein TadG
VSPGPGRGRRGQATVEVALVLPVVVLVLLLVVQVALVARAQLLVTNAAREGARAAAVRPGSAAAAVRRSPGMAAGRVAVVERGGGSPGDIVQVTVRWRVATDVAIVGFLVPDPVVSATVAMRVEGPVG